MVRVYGQNGTAVYVTMKMDDNTINRDRKEAMYKLQHGSNRVIILTKVKALKDSHNHLCKILFLGSFGFF